ncbi:MAG: OmpA family protein [Bacteroidales bacterium]|nr:OmpA family protein [Bacteroidales bacterium]
MKTLTILTILTFCFTIGLTAQINLDKVVKNSKKKTENKIEKRIENKIDNAVDKTLDDIEGGVKNDSKDKNKDKSDKNEKDSDSKESDMVGGDGKNKEEDKSTNTQDTNNKTHVNNEPVNNEPVVTWSKFDFVPGDQLIFEDGPSNSERNGEFPSRWDLKSGVAEIINVDGENVICFMAQNTEIMPYIKDADKPYLPDVFTVEMDLYFSDEYSHHRYYIYLSDRKNHQNAGYFVIYVNGITIGDFSATLPGSKSKQKEKGGWKRVSIAYTNGQLKAYLDDTRLINIPRYEHKPTGITIEGEMYSDTKRSKYLKNFRIAEGGVPYYDRAMQDGKIIVTGIRFDVGKATIKPESMGPLNEILYVMQKNPEINFSVEGHTDSDGDDATNQKLSEDRAKAVMDKLIEMGIDKSRLTYKGFGESKPMVENTSAEGKAQNRRVEFVKF